MQVSVSITDPRLLAEARDDDLFVVRTAELQECVCVRAQHGLDSPKVRAATSHVLAEMLGLIGEHATAEFLRMEAYVDVAVVGCRVARGEPGFVRSGTVLPLPPTTPVQFVELVERASFRERAAAEVTL